MRAFRRLAVPLASLLAATGGVVTSVALPADAATTGFGYGAPQFVNSAAPSDL